MDEIDTARGYISWVSPVARALIKAREGDVVTLHAPAGIEELEVLEVKYQPIPMTPFAPLESQSHARPGEPPTPA